jgi:hypothetical protein
MSFKDCKHLESTVRPVDIGVDCVHCEIERLRAALKQIASVPYGIYVGPPTEILIARAALSPSSSNENE